MFNNRKCALSRVTQTAHPQMGRSFIVDSDASAASLGEALSQKDEDGRGKPVLLSSRGFGPDEKEISNNRTASLRGDLGFGNLPYLDRRFASASVR